MSKALDSVHVSAVLGSGSFGTVLLAELDSQQMTGIIALKRIKTRTPLLDSRELRALSQVTGESVCALYLAFASVDSRGEQFHNLALSYLPSTMQQVINRLPMHTSPQWDATLLARIKGYCRGLLLGLATLHDAHWIHRDVSGRNVLLSEDDTVKVCDLGCACRDDDGLLRCTRIGNQAYRSPEQFFGCPRYGTGVDVWSAALLMAEFGHRKSIFPGNKTETLPILTAIEFLGPPPPKYTEKYANQQVLQILGTRLHKMRVMKRRKMRHAFSPEFSAFIYSMLRWDPLERPTARQLLLDSFLHE